VSIKTDIKIQQCRGLERLRETMQQQNPPLPHKTMVT
jgi:hypothetical protein